VSDTADHDGPPDGAEQPAPEPQGVPENNAPNPDPSPKPNEDKQLDAVDKAMVRWTRAVGVFTGVLAIVGVVQSWAFIQSERAALYVNVEAIIPNPIVADKPITVAITVFNKGRSQAFITDGRAELGFYYYDIPDKPTFKKPIYPLNGPIPSDKGYRHWQIGPSDVLNWAQVEEIEIGRTKVAVFGYVTYVDDFTMFGPRSVGFCGIYDSKPEQQKNILPVPPFSECGKPAYVYYK
jgi:hypothetical protein